LYRVCGIIKRCVLKEETNSITSHYHDSLCGGHASIDKAIAKIFQADFYWLTLFKDVYKYIRACDQCQRTGNLSRQNVMPLNYILEVEVFDIWL